MSSYEKLRATLLQKATILSMVHMPYLGKGGTPMGINFGTAATIFENFHREDYPGQFSCVRYYETDDNYVPLEFPVRNERLATAAAADFKKIPGSPIAYWVSEAAREAFTIHPSISEFFFSDGLTKTGNNEKFLRYHWEVERRHATDRNRYRICVKGGDARSYFGNTDILVTWTPEARQHYRTDNVARITPDYLWEQSGISWTKISSKGPTFRWFGNGMIAETGGPAIFANQDSEREVLWQGLGFLASKVSWNILTSLNPTLNFQTNDVLSLPINLTDTRATAGITQSAFDLSVHDWDAYETSWDFSDLPLLRAEFRRGSLAATYAALRGHWQANTDEMQRLEEENNRLFIDAYGLHDELTPQVPLAEITLTCNPHYRYNSSKSAEELEALLLADTMRESGQSRVGS